MLSTFKLNFELGLITAMTITLALIVDFLLLPAMLLTFDKADYANDKVSDPDFDLNTSDVALHQVSR